MIRRIQSLLVTVILMLGLIGCTQSVDQKAKEDFVDKEWTFYDEVSGEHLCLNLKSDGTYSYHCQCGEPVGNSDLYEKYEYDAENGIITLSNSYDDSTDQIEVIDYNEYHLMVKIDGELKDFILGELDTTSSFYSFEGESYLEGYESRCVVVDIQDGKIIYGPTEYDPEGSYKDGPFEEYELAGDIPVFELYITRFMSIQDDQEYEEFYDVAYTEIDEQDEQFMEDMGSGEAFLWFDEELKVEKIVYHGDLAVTADYISVNVPGELLGETTQEFLNSQAEEGLFDAAHLNEDGSVIYLMMEEQYDAIMADLKSVYASQSEKQLEEIEKLYIEAR